MAEDANTHQALGPGEERIVEDGFVLWMGPGAEPHWNVAQRLRLDPGGVPAAVERVRGLLRERGRLEATWEVGTSATPPGLVDRLTELGMRLDDDPHLIALVCTAEPPAGGDVEVVRVRTRTELDASDSVMQAAFGGDVALRDPDAAFARYLASPDAIRYLALADGRPVAAATATFTPHGAVLNAGSTLPGFRGRGAYRALVRARWEDAVARGTPALITQAGRMSRPILERLGFEAVAQITVLVDGFGDG